ncbi:hypothetical protein [uncultured Erythrobacter sp.]|uniref:hypothetical protein n=1 Tax=uncultured Erythrobacter sp. TaxID=263913 RepID=UPI00265B4E1A|nr:hypothetical protein [uncultured Erythrobacter sp.]
MTSLPRRDASELLTQAQLNNERKILVVEGEIDARVISDSCFNRHLPIDVYPISAIDSLNPESPELYGGNKSAIIGLFSNDNSGLDECDGIFGLVDRDFDFHRNIQRTEKSIIYTEFTTLFSFGFSEEFLIRFFDKILMVNLPVKFISNFHQWSSSYFSFLLNWREICFDESPPSIKSYVRPIEKGGFDWKGYGVAVKSKSSGRLANLNLHDRRCLGDVLLNIHEHHSLFYLYLSAITSKFIDKKLPFEQFEHLWIARYREEIECCATWKRILRLPES